MTRLRRAVPLMPGESLPSFVSRLASRHGIPANAFCQDMGIPFLDLVYGSERALSRLAELTGSDLGRLSVDAMTRVDGAWYLRGQKLFKHSLRRDRLTFCPACLQDDIKASTLPPETSAYGRSNWLLLPLRTCPAHGMGLFEVTDCSRVLDVHDFSDRARVWLHRLKELIQAAPKREPSGLECYLMDRLDGRSTTSEWLDSLEFYVAARTCEMLGAVAVAGRNTALSRFEADDWQRFGAAGFEIAGRGEGGVADFLSRLVSEHEWTASGNERKQSVYGKFYQWLAFSARSSDYDPVRDLVRRHIVDSMPVAEGTELLGCRAGRRKLHSIRSAALESGLHPSRLRRVLAANGHIDADQAGKLDAAVFFDAEKAAPLIAKLGESFSIKGAAAYLNAPMVQTKILAKSGHVGLVTGDPQRALRPRIARHVLDDFMERLSRDANDVAVAAGDVQAIPQAVKRARCTTDEILDLLLGRKLKWVGRDPNVRGYLSVLVNVSEVKEAVRGIQVGLAQRGLVERLRTTQKTVQALIEDGILPTDVVVNPVNRCPTTIVRYEHIESFERRFVSLFELSNARGIHHLALKARLAEAGVTPTLTRERYRASFYLRENIPV